MVMRLVIDTSPVTFQVSKDPVPKVDRDTGQQRTDRDTGGLLWTVQLIAMDPVEGAEVINVTVAGEAPKVAVGQPARVEGLQAIPWQSNNGGVKVAYRAAVIAPVVSKAA
jgi:hypothetical protein